MEGGTLRLVRGIVLLSPPIQNEANIIVYVYIYIYPSERIGIMWRVGLIWQSTTVSIHEYLRPEYASKH